MLYLRAFKRLRNRKRHDNGTCFIKSRGHQRSSFESNDKESGKDLLNSPFQNFFFYKNWIEVDIVNPEMTRCPS